MKIGRISKFRGYKTADTAFANSSDIIQIASHLNQSKTDRSTLNVNRVFNFFDIQFSTQDTAVGRKIEAVNTLKNLRQFLVDIKSSI
ncbi:MAG: hypothetical protein ACJAZ3_000984 [Sphingobacteriales bacterium]|jgi:hypothetical protein